MRLVDRLPFLVVIVLMFSVIHVSAQVIDEVLFPVPYETNEGRLIGYINANGEVVLPAIFSAGRPFAGGSAVVGTNRVSWAPTDFGVIDSSGQFFLPPNYEDVIMTERRNAWVLQQGSWSYIRTDNGKFVFERTFDRVAPYSEGKAIVEYSKAQWAINEQGEEVFSLSSQNLFAILLKHGNVDAFPVGVAQYRDDRLLVIAGQPAAGLRTIVFLDGEGEVAIPARTYLAGGINPFSQGYAALQEPAPGKIGGGEAFFIDRHGERAFGGRVWRGVKSFSEGLAAVSTLSASPSQHRPARWGFIDRNGEMVIEDIYWDVEPFSEGLAAVAVELDSLVPGNRDGLWGAIDQNGVMVIEPQFRSPFRFRDGLAQLFEPYEIHSIAGVQLSGPIRGTTMRYIDRNGRTVWDERDHRPVD